MIIFSQNIFVVLNLLKSIILTWNLYSQTIISYNLIINLPNNSIYHPSLLKSSIEYKSDQQLFEDPNFKDCNGYYLYQGFEII